MPKEWASMYKSKEYEQLLYWYGELYASKALPSVKRRITNRVTHLK